MSEHRVGTVSWISGPVIRADNVGKLSMMEQVEIGEERLIGEVLELDDDMATIQVYEDTTGLKPGAPIYGTGSLLFVELGPGLLKNIYDGIQRPLEGIQTQQGDFIERGAQVVPLDREKHWHFTPVREVGEQILGGEILGEVPETEALVHRILCPPNMKGELLEIAEEGDYTIERVIARIKTQDGEQDVRMYQRWPVRHPRPYRQRLNPTIPLITGQRVIDTFFPLAKGGTAAVPGGFGTGKTITQHQLAKWCNANLIVYIGCGERGNEMTGVLVDFPELIDPKTAKPLMERTILIANTSDMPVAAREASIYTGITIAEYYRDMGYDVAIMADSTSRWAEALREISGRLEEMPAEEGFPAYLATRLAEFYERAGRVSTLMGKEGSVSVIGAVSPPGGDFSEPVTQHTKRFVRCFWGLDKELASARYFPAINYMDSYSEYLEDISGWWDQFKEANWSELRAQAMALLQQDDKLQKIVKLVGEDALPDDQRLIIEGARLLKESLLQQSAFDDVDMYAEPLRQLWMLNVIIHFYERAGAIIKKGAPIYRVREMEAIENISRMKARIPNNEVDKFADLVREIDSEFNELEQDYSGAFF
ncbi:V-type ATP synthase subunit A [candidate division KSB3 bacterium]|uniref:V-type ATP synthase alpha chain n=1 Tax=candidate division KSB3 bacterium TaxID=2044937 RepID=A0A2G6E995_9BACT|nr:MAG: V-type ATP synthase subunit A [candidate division KSB3 bacterium]PIE29588.1 MAG: V-type ATP synthase subunit A [candidate division KSB3 bacterium]